MILVILETILDAVLFNLGPKYIYESRNDRNSCKLVITGKRHAYRFNRSRVGDVPRRADINEAR